MLEVLVRRTELLQRYGDGMDFAIEDMETYAHEARLPGEHLVLFLLATYGDGEPTDNALEFYNWVTAAAKGADGGAGDDQLLKVRCMAQCVAASLTCSSLVGPSCFLATHVSS